MCHRSVPRLQTHHHDEVERQANPGFYPKYVSKYPKSQMDFLNEFFMVWMIDDDSWRERGLIHMLMGNKTNMKFDALLNPEKDGMFLSFPCFV